MALDRTGPASAPYNNIETETVAGEIKAGPLNTNVANLKMAGQTHMHELNGKVGWDSMKSDFRPPDTGDSTSRWRTVSGVITIAGSSGSGSGTITFATDSDQGDPSFTTAPRLVVTACAGSGSGEWMADYPYSGPATTNVTIQVNQLNGGTNTGSVKVYWIAYGKVA